MRRPSVLAPWFTPDQLLNWVQEAPDKGAYQRRLAIWMTQAGPFSASRVAELLGVSTQAVWKWLGEYNKLGPEGLERKKRGGRRWGLMSLAAEHAFLAQCLAGATVDDLPTAKKLHPALCQALGRDVSMDYVYKLLRRHEWGKLKPRRK